MVRILGGTNLTVLLDERGTPGKRGQFVMCAVLAPGRRCDIEARWEESRKTLGIRERKSRKMNDERLRKAAEKLRELDVVPIGVHSELTEADVDKLQAKVKEYANSTHSAKTASRISGASWVWKAQANALLGYATTVAVLHFLRLRHIDIEFDKVTDKKEVRERYQNLLTDRLKYPTRLAKMREGAGRLWPLADLVSAACLGRKNWTLNMSSKGALADLPDIACTLYARHLKTPASSGWSAWTRELFTCYPQARAILARDVTSTIRSFINKIVVPPEEL